MERWVTFTLSHQHLATPLNNSPWQRSHDSPWQRSHDMGHMTWVTWRIVVIIFPFSTPDGALHRDQFTSASGDWVSGCFRFRQWHVGSCPWDVEQEGEKSWLHSQGHRDFYLKVTAHNCGQWKLWGIYVSWQERVNILPICWIFPSRNQYEHTFPRRTISQLARNLKNLENVANS